MNTKVEEALGARCEAAFVAIETAANTIQYDYRGGHGAELLLPLRDARTIIVELNERIAQQDATIARMAALAETWKAEAASFEEDGEPGGQLADFAEQLTDCADALIAALTQGEVK